MNVKRVPIWNPVTKESFADAGNVESIAITTVMEQNKQKHKRPRGYRKRKKQIHNANCRGINHHRTEIKQMS